MDPLTFLPYIGILILTALNAVLVVKRNIKVDDEESSKTDS